MTFPHYSCTPIAQLCHHERQSMLQREFRLISISSVASCIAHIKNMKGIELLGINSVERKDMVTGWNAMPDHRGAARGPFLGQASLAPSARQLPVPRDLSSVLTSSDMPSPPPSPKPARPASVEHVHEPQPRASEDNPNAQLVKTLREQIDDLLHQVSQLNGKVRPIDISSRNHNSSNL